LAEQKARFALLPIDFTDQQLRDAPLGRLFLSKAVIVFVPASGSLRRLVRQFSMDG
jgi:hypothetical protein